MRRGVLVFVLFFGVLAVNAQRKRTTATFDADTTTRPATGLYGIGVRDKQPFLVSPTGEAKRFVMESKYIAAHWFSVEADTAELPMNKEIIFLGGGDSTYVKLPTIVDTTNSHKEYSILFFGWKGGTDSLTYMDEDTTRVLAYTDEYSILDNIVYTHYYETFKVTFSDTIYYQRGWKGAILKTVSFSDRTNMPSPFLLYPNRWINIRRKEGKWWLF